MHFNKRFLLNPLAAGLLVLSTSSALAFTDTDSDGMDDQWELWWGFNPADGADAALDNDADNLTNLQEYTLQLLPTDKDTDGDGVNDNTDTFPKEQKHAADTDTDGMPDGWEQAHGLTPLSSDSNLDADTDGLTNTQEFVAGTDPQLTDSDQDGMDDGTDKWPANAGYNLDTDNDNLPDAWETQYNLCTTCPGDAAADYDGDSLTNQQEFYSGTKPNNNNTDGDVLPDNTDQWPTNASHNTDADNDDLPDAWEVANGLNPSDAIDASNPIIGDSDKLTPLQEFTLGTNPQNNDTDGDGDSDRHDIEPVIAHPGGDQDHDFDGIPLWWETLFGTTDTNAADAVGDADNDSASNVQEFLRGTFPDIAQDQDTDNDRLPDGWELSHGLFVPHNDTNMDYDVDNFTNLQEFLAGTDPQVADSDRDGVNDGIDKWPVHATYSTDTDNDGLPDAWETQYGLCAACSGDANIDIDSDTLNNLQEFTLGTHPNNPNTDNDVLDDNNDQWPADPAYNMDNDNDGLPDEWEWDFWLNAYDATDANDPLLGDSDKLTPLQEFLLGTDPYASDSDSDLIDDRHDIKPVVAHTAGDLDQDFDGLPQWWEQAFGMSDLNPMNAGYDGDSDGTSALQEYQRGTFPDIGDDRDDDLDRMPDGWEQAHNFLMGFNDSNLDADSDGLTNVQEYRANTDPRRADTDNDGMNDSTDKWPTKPGYNLDTDNDGLPDAWEIANSLCPSCPGDTTIDMDGDTLTTLQEFALGTHPANMNTDDDWLPDNEDKWPTNAYYNADNDNDGLPDDWEIDNGLSTNYAGDANDPLLGDYDMLSPLQEFLLGTDPGNADSDSDNTDDRYDFAPLVAHPMDEDLDFDGIPGWWETAFGLYDGNAYTASYDYDNDQASNVQEFQRGTDPDIADDRDDDSDGMPNGWEMAHGFAPYANDSNNDLDADGLDNLAEFRASTDPGMADSDRDGVHDGADKWPATASYSLDADNDGMADEWENAQSPPLSTYSAMDAGLDPDGDTRTNRQEFEGRNGQRSNPYLMNTDGDIHTDQYDFWPTDPNGYDNNMNQLPDQWENTYFGYTVLAMEANSPMFTDDDQLSPVQEFKLGTNPLLTDTDSDGSDDRHDTWPAAAGYQSDDDFDGMPSEWETTYNLDPFNPTDGANELDGDGLTNLQEFRFGSAPDNTDSDGDSIADNTEVFTTHTHPGLSDTDGDGRADNTDAFPNNAAEWMDTDNDGTGNNADTDDDNDFYYDYQDDYPLDPTQHDANAIYPMDGIYKGSTINDTGSVL